VKEGERVFDRWKDLPETERLALERDARRGRALARALLARDFQRTGADADAAAMLREALIARPLLALRPVACGVLLRRLIGHRAARALDGWLDHAIRRYRSTRFDYRYLRGG
jgi:hypothetical protein